MGASISYSTRGMQNITAVAYGYLLLLSYTRHQASGLVCGRGLGLGLGPGLALGNPRIIPGAIIERHLVLYRSRDTL